MRNEDVLVINSIREFYNKDLIDCISKYDIWYRVDCNDLGMVIDGDIEIDNKEKCYLLMDDEYVENNNKFLKELIPILEKEGFSQDYYSEPCDLLPDEEYDIREFNETEEMTELNPLITKLALEIKNSERLEIEENYDRELLALEHEYNKNKRKLKLKLYKELLEIEE